MKINIKEWGFIKGLPGIKEFNKGIRAKVFLLFLVMGAFPFITLILISARSTIAELEISVKQSGELRNTLISEHISSLVKINQHVLRSLALNPLINQYIQAPSEEKLATVTKLLNETNDIFNDTNFMVFTGSDAQQIIRTDNSTLVNVGKRQHFQEAMKGRGYVSDILKSMSTGKMIVVIEEPVLDAEGKPVGMVQRNFDLEALQEFIQFINEDDISIVVMDRTGKVIANSESIEELGDEYMLDNKYKFIIDKVYNSSGVIHTDIDGVDSLLAYSRNVDTGWMIVTIRSYDYIYDQAKERAVKSIAVGLSMLLAGILIAYLFAIRATKPIIEMTNVVDDIVSGKASVNKIEVNSDDELGQMAAAFNKIKSDRDAYQLESELDKLTELFNKKTMENLCRMKLKTFNENEASNIFMAFYIIDLDHFKEVNDILGHQFGDRVLVEFAKGLKKIFRPNDCIGRFGGDEFVVIVDSLPNMEVVLRKAEQIKQIAFNMTIDGKERFVTASIGIAIAPQSGRDYDTLFAAADKAVYHVKNSGKNGYYCELFDNNDDES
jgi:diguanylate cyclase (GGDEF)-like protein